jgi:hypothetical protein
MVVVLALCLVLLMLLGRGTPPRRASGAETVGTCELLANQGVDRLLVAQRDHDVPATSVDLAEQFGLRSAAYRSAERVVGELDRQHDSASGQGGPALAALIARQCAGSLRVSPLPRGG